MKKLLPILVLGAALTACKSKAPAATEVNEPTTASRNLEVKSFTPAKALRTKFAKDFPNAKLVSWTKNDVRAYVDFVNSQGHKSEAVYGFDGTLLENKVGSDVNALPVSVKNFLNTKYPNNAVQNAYTVRNGSTKKYILVQLKDAQDVLFDLDGNFLNYKPE